MAADNTKVVHVRLADDGPAAVDAAVQALGHYFETGAIPDGGDIVVESFETFAARGRVADCDCELIQCVCTEARKHVKGCDYRLALTCAIPIACGAHGVDVCPQCDPCTCATVCPGEPKP